LTPPTGWGKVPLVSAPPGPFRSELMANRLFSYFRESREELKKVAWPNRHETRNNTLLVIGISVFVAVFLGLLDLLFSYLMNLGLNFR